MNVLEMVRAAKEIGPVIGRCKFFGLKTDDQGTALALLSFQSGKPLEEYMRTFHCVDGKLTMRADAMLAGLVELGGKYRVLRRDENGASMEVAIRGETQKFELSWSDAQKEAFTKNRDGGVKDNYATPRVRMQMLWARVVSDAVRVMAPQVNRGVYTPEEFDGGGDESQMPEVSAPERKASETIDLGSQGEATAATETSIAPAIEREPRVPVDEATVQEIRSLAKELGCGAPIVNRLSQFGLKGVADMTLGDAKTLLGELKTKKSLADWLTVDLEPPGN